MNGWHEKPRVNKIGGRFRAKRAAVSRAGERDTLDVAKTMGEHLDRRAFRLSFLSTDAEVVAPKAPEILTRVRSVPAWDGATISAVDGQFTRAHITWHAGAGFNIQCFADEASLGHFLVSKNHFSPTTVEINLGGQALERWPRELFVPESLAAEALDYFLEHRGLKPSLSWTRTGDFPRESIWQGRKEREAWERRHQSQ